MKVLLILVDGMRPDAMENLPKAKGIMKRGASTMRATTVMPSITLPCHMSLFHSVDPGRHGTTTNVYAPQVRPINGLFDVLAAAKKWGAMYYNWQELRDVARPGNVMISNFHRGKSLGFAESDVLSVENAIRDLNNEAYDIPFAFL